MNSLDAGIIVVILASALWSMRQGFLREILSIAVVVFAVVVSLHLHGRVGQALSEKGFGEQGGHIMGFVIAFFAAAILGGLACKLVQFLVVPLLLRWLDGLLGALLGVIKGVLVVCVTLIVLTTYVDGSRALLGRSKLSGPMLQVAHLMTPLFPKGLSRTFNDRLNELRTWMEDQRIRSLPAAPQRGSPRV